MNPFAPFIYMAMGASMLSALCFAWPLALLNDRTREKEGRKRGEKREKDGRNNPVVILACWDDDMQEALL